MKKIITSLFKSIERKNKLQLIKELLTHDIPISESIELFLKVKSDFYYEMEQKQKQIKKESDLIKALTYPHSSTVKDPNFNKPLNQIETNYEQITTDIHGNS